MEKNCWKSKRDPDRLLLVILAAGGALTVILGVKALGEHNFGTGAWLPRNPAGDGAYEQELLVSVNEMKNCPVTVTVEEQSLSREEAEQRFSEAAVFLDQEILGENECADAVTGDLNLIQGIPSLGVEILWMTDALEYFYPDGRLREECDFKEPVSLIISAVLSCQEYTGSYEREVTLCPVEESSEQQLLRFLKQEEASTRELSKWQLPKTYNGSRILFKKPWDLTFVYLGVLTGIAGLLFKLAQKQDQKRAYAERILELERDYAQIVGKFAMLLSAGLSIRNAWERIVQIQKKKPEEMRAVYEEMNRTWKEIQKGVPERSAYEMFGTRTGLVHYKKLMALFVSEQRHGGGGLLRTMEQEMFEAWEEQKRRIRQQGEKRSTKLLLPMMGMLGVVFMMILVPAFLSFQI